MAKLWGITAGDENKPNWLTAEEKENCFADNTGWVLRHPDGTLETLVAIKGLSLAAKLAAATITEVKFGGGTYTAGTTKTVKVSFNERVTVTGNPTLVVSGTGDADATATYASSNTAGTTLTFEFTVPVATTTMSIAAQSISLAGGTITETGVSPTVNAGLAISAGVASAAGTKVAV